MLQRVVRPAFDTQQQKSFFVEVSSLHPYPGACFLQGKASHLEGKNYGVYAQHRAPVLGQDRKRHEPRVKVDVRVPRAGGTHDRRGWSTHTQKREPRQNKRQPRLSICTVAVDKGNGWNILYQYILV